MKPFLYSGGISFAGRSKHFVMLIEQPAKFLRWLYPHALWRMDKEEHAVYLTFDDGPIPPFSWSVTTYASILRNSKW